MKFKFDSNSTPNFGRFRLKDPKIFVRMWTRKDAHDPGISYVVGTLADGKYATQTILFDRSVWTEKKAGTWWKKNSSRFTLKVRKNPKDEPFSWYIDNYKSDLIEPKQLTRDQKRKIKEGEGYVRSEYVGKYKEGQIYLCYLELFDASVLYGIIEVYPVITQYHDFRNKVHQYKNKPNVDKLNQYLYTYFVENI